MNLRLCSIFGLLLAFAAASPARSTWHERHLLKRSNTVTTPESLSGQTFDYVIVGGGTAGLTVAARLSENSSVTVAVIEAGSDGSAVETQILAPAEAYVNGIANANSPYDWGYFIEPQTNMNNRSVIWPRGKVLGGSSATNGLYMVRASSIEHDSWASLMPGNESKWNWDQVYPYMKKSENWTAPRTENLELAGGTYDASLHGSDGPIHYSYPGFFYPQVAEWLPTLANLGVDNRDPGGGQVWGAFIATSAINPSNWSRSYAYNGYYAQASTRSNLVVLSGYHVTKINFDGTTATGVSFAASANGTSYSVSASKEVILSAGVIGTPQLLQLSGVGPSDLLSSLGIQTVVDLPGVGAQLTDHLSGGMVFNTTGIEYTGDLLTNNATFAAEQLDLWRAGNPDSMQNSPNDAIAYLNLTTIMGASNASALMDLVASVKDAQISAYSTNAELQAGYNATYTAEQNDILPSAVGQAEILMSNTGSYSAYGDSLTVTIQAALQHPFSRGYVRINSTDPFVQPKIDPSYLTHPADIEILRSAFRFARRTSQTAPLSQYLTTELSPGLTVQTDDEWDDWIKSVCSTEYHPAGTASMLPLSQGGVVDSDLRVYGTSNLRIVDASVVSVSFSAHMTAPLYGIAENAVALITSTSTSSSSSSSSDSSSTSTSSTTSTTSGASSESGSSRTENDATSLQSPLCIALTFALMTFMSIL